MKIICALLQGLFFGIGAFVLLFLIFSFAALSLPSEAAYFHMRIFSAIMFFIGTLYYILDIRVIDKY